MVGEDPRQMLANTRTPHRALLKVCSRAAIHTDEGNGWANLHAYREVRQVKHKERYVAKDGAHINWVESFNSRVRRAERGVHHRLTGPYLQGYADEFCWREDFRRIDNGRQFSNVLRAVAGMPVSRNWKGYWQRRISDRQQIAQATMALP